MIKMQMDKIAVVSLLMVVVGVQCAPVKPTNMYDTLFNWTTENKCTYLQNTSLLHGEDLQFLHDCGDREANLAADLSQTYNIEKLHCLLYYETFVTLCKLGSEKEVKPFFSEPVVKNANKQLVSEVCIELKTFYHTDNISKVGNALKKDGQCEKICANIDGSLMKACSYSALMTNVWNQIVSQQNKNSTKVENSSPKILSDPVGQDFAVAGQDASQQQLADKNKAQALPKNKDVEKPAAGQGQVSETDLHPDQLSGKSDKTKTTTIKSVKTNEDALESVEKPPSNEMAPKKAAVPEESEAKPVSKEVQDSVKTDVEQASKDSDKSVLSQQADIKSSQVSTSTKATDKVEEQQNYEDDEQEEVQVEETEPPAPIPKSGKPLQTSKDDDFTRMTINNDDLSNNDSYFFTYFMMFCILFVMGYVGYHNKQKLLALVLEGRRGRRQPRRRPNSANYHKLDSNLEEAVTSSCDKTTSNVIY